MCFTPAARCWSIATTTWRSSTPRSTSSGPGAALHDDRPGSGQGCFKPKARCSWTPMAPTRIPRPRHHGRFARGALPTCSVKRTSPFTPEELALAHKVLERLEWNPGQRRTRRWIPGRVRVSICGGPWRAARTGGDVLVRRAARPSARGPSCCWRDVGGSMERYSRMLLHFAHAMSRRHRQVEAFLFSTQLTRITRQLRARRIDAAVTACRRPCPWSAARASATRFAPSSTVVAPRGAWWTRGAADFGRLG